MVHLFYLSRNLHQFLMTPCWVDKQKLLISNPKKQTYLVLFCCHHSELSKNDLLNRHLYDFRTCLV